LIGSVAASAVCDIMNPLLPSSLGCACEAAASGVGGTSTCTQTTPSIGLGVTTIPSFTMQVGTDLLPCGDPAQAGAHVSVSLPSEVTSSTSMMATLDLALEQLSAQSGIEAKIEDGAIKVEQVVEAGQTVPIDLPLFGWGSYGIFVRILVTLNGDISGLSLESAMDVCGKASTKEYCGADLADLIYGYDLSQLIGSPPWEMIEMSATAFEDACATDTAAAEAAAAADKPCFARDSIAIGSNGESVAMASLRSGDVVMDGPDSYTRVIVNQHAAVSVKSSLLHIGTADATLSVTPDHVINVDGKFAAARTVGVGSKLGEQEVVRVTSSIGEIINPLTASGKILTQGGLLATTYPEWIADFMLSSTLFPLPFSLSNAISYLFPETTQAFYDGVVESFVTAHHPMHLKAALPAPLIPAAFALGDLALAVGFVAFSLASPMALVALAAVAASQAFKARK